MAEGLHATITADTQQYETGMQRAIAATDKFTAASKQAASSSKSLSGALGMSGVRDVSAGLNNISEAGRGVASSFKLAKGASSQFGYQIQDIAVQLQMGTNAAMVFAQQGSQIASMFGPGGAALGAVIAIAGAIGGPLLYALFDSTDAAKDLTSELDELTEGFHELSAAERAYIELSTARRIAEARDQIIQLREGVADANKQITALTAHEEFGWEKGVQTATESIIEQEAAIGRLEGKIKEFEKLGAIARGEIKGEDQQKEEKDQADRYARMIEKAEEFERQKAALRIAVFAEAEGTEEAIEAGKYELKLQRLQEYLENKIITEQEYRELELAATEAHEAAISDIMQNHIDKRTKMEQDAQNKINALRAGAIQNGINLLGMFASKNKALAIAQIALSKGLAIAQVYAQTQTAAMLAYSSQLVPGDPTSIARAQAAYAKTQGMGKLSMALIAASGLAQAAGLGGGGAGGAGGGSSTESGGGAGGGAQASASENSIVNINLEGDRFDKKSVIGLIEQINEAVADGARINVR